jgi:predicted transcriptional regulator
MEKLTSKEEEVMELIWQLTNEARAEGKLAGTMPGKEEEGESQIGQCAPKDVSSLYPEPQPSANAIAQVFQALEKKGYLTHEPKGRGFVYRPIVDKQAYGRGRLSSVINRFFNDSYMSVVSALMQEDKVTEADLLQYLADLKRKDESKEG